MKELVSIFLIGVSLSMDTFSLSLSLGTLKTNAKIFILPILVGILHFFMPLLGNLLGSQLISLLSLTSHKILGFILIILAINIAIHFFKQEDTNFNVSMLGLTLIAISVSIDSFSVGLGISALTSKYFLASTIFALCSATFTYLGLSIGKYCSNKLGKLANILGITLLLILGIIHLIK